ncbi:hypothetical protein GCM10023165_16370 [Variovorax defluvii]|uniref:Uncharacterized protein n=1 Tax=Variovorax defluvii TaxID=913761 RepID=A0ABP8HDS6_9BURK
MEAAISDGVHKLYIQDFAKAGLSDASARLLFADAGVESLDVVQVGDQLVPVGDRMKTLPRERSVTLEQRREQSFEEAPKRPRFLLMEFKL